MAPTPIKKKRLNPEAVFLISTVASLTILVISIIFILNFLVSRLNLALSTEDLRPSAEAARFNIKGAEELNLGK